jgi:Asp-tRNA(Asn)/Glu-tRNA(Gln) amidotransferase A subunit family amidase
MDFRRTTVAEIAEQVATRAMSAREVVQAALDRIDR